MPSTRDPTIIGDRLFIAALVAALAAMVAMAWFLPPLLDVYYYDSQAVQALVHGANPYGHTYVGIPGWLATPGASNVFAYLPAVPLFLLPFGAVWDVRLGLIAADLVVAMTLRWIGGRSARIASLLFLLLPFDWLFATSYPNNTLVAMCFLGAAALLELRGRKSPAAMALGVSVAASQFMWLVYPLFAYRYFRTGRGRDALVSLGAAAVLIAPFFLWNPAAFVSNAILFQFGRPVQSLVTPMAFGYNVNPTLNGLAATLVGAAVPIYIRAPIDAAAILLAIQRSKSTGAAFANATWFLLLSVWLLASDFSWWYLELPFQTLLIWWALRSGPASAQAPPNP